METNVAAVAAELPVHPDVTVSRRAWQDCRIYGVTVGNKLPSLSAARVGSGFLLLRAKGAVQSH